MNGPENGWAPKCFFSHAGEAASLAQLRDAGLVVRESAVERQDNEEIDFLWIAAVKPQG